MRNPIPGISTFHDSVDYQKLDRVNLGRDVVLASHLNLYGCEIGDETKIGAFVEIQEGVVIGQQCKISSHTFICSGVQIDNGVFIGHNVTFVNDKHPRATLYDEEEGTILKRSTDWDMLTTRVHSGASIGSGAVIMGGVWIGEDAVIGAGAVVTKNVPPRETWVGNPARPLRHSFGLRV